MTYWHFCKFVDEGAATVATSHQTRKGEMHAWLGVPANVLGPVVEKLLHPLPLLSAEVDSCVSR